MAKVLMCIANISEGRRKDVLEAVAAAVRAVPGVLLSDWSGDPDHNRAVYTMLGPPDAVLAGAKALTESALEQIDMTVHEGEHPRLGAVDVVPFIPLREWSRPRRWTWRGPTERGSVSRACRCTTTSTPRRSPSGRACPRSAGGSTRGSPTS